MTKTPRTSRTKKTPRMTQEEQLLQGLQEYADGKKEEYEKKPYLSKIYDAIKTYLPKLSIVACVSFAMYLLSNYSLVELFTMNEGVLSFSANILELYIAYLAYSRNWFGNSKNWFGKKKSMKKNRYLY